MTLPITCIHGITPKKDCKICRSIIQHEYVMRHKDQIKKYLKEYNHRQYVKEKQKNYFRGGIPQLIKYYTNQKQNLEDRIKGKYMILPVGIEGKLISLTDTIENLKRIDGYIDSMNINDRQKKLAKRKAVENLLENEGLIVSRRKKLPSGII